MPADPLPVLMSGDIVGAPGRAAFARAAAAWRADGRAQVVLANAENAAGGRGPTPEILDEILAAGADALTLGDHTWDQKELAGSLARFDRVARPANFPPGAAGQGYAVVPTPAGPLAVVSLIGRVFMPPNDCPFQAMDRLLAGPLAEVRMIMVDIHAEATSEKEALGYFLDGRVTAVVGTHTHVQTADAQILPGGTAYLTDLGMTGPARSILGREIAPIVARFQDGMPRKADVARGDAVFCGALIEADPESGRALAIRTVRET